MSEPISTSFDSSEQWKPIPGYEGWFSASSEGRIRRDTATQNYPIGKIRKASLGKNGYFHLMLSVIDQPRRQFCVHYLVALAFLGPRPKGMEVNHKNAIKTDNRLANLEYVTRRQNSEHAKRNGLLRPPHGATHPCAKLNEDQVRQIRVLLRTQRICKICRQFSVTKETIMAIRDGVTWKHVA